MRTWVNVLERDESVRWVATVVVVIVGVEFAVARPMAATASPPRSETETQVTEASSSLVVRVRMKVSDGNR